MNRAEMLTRLLRGETVVVTRADGSQANVTVQADMPELAAAMVRNHLDICESCVQIGAASWALCPTGDKLMSRYVSLLATTPEGGGDAG